MWAPVRAEGASGATGYFSTETWGSRLVEREKTKKGDEPGEKGGLRARARGIAVRGQAPYRGSSDGLNRLDPAGTSIPGFHREKGKEHIQEDGKAPSPPTPPARVLLADDHPLFRGALKGLLDGASDLEVVGEAGTDGRHSNSAAL